MERATHRHTLLVFYEAKILTKELTLQRIGFTLNALSYSSFFALSYNSVLTLF